MATAPSSPPRILSVLLLTLLTTSAGCSSAGFSGQSAAFSGHDVQLRTSGDTLYVLARSQGVSRNFCASLGGDVARAEGQWAATEGRTMQLGRVAGCHTVRHIIVCSDEDGACLAHEERHKVEGAFHR
jgi:hypothetical protein